DALKVVSEKPIDATKWHHLAVTYDGSAKAAGVKVYVDGVAQKTQVEADALKGTTRTTVPFKIAQRNGVDAIKGLAVQDLRLYGKALSAGEIASLAKSTRLASIVSKPVEQRTEGEKKDVYDWWLNTNDQPTKEMAVKLSTLEQEDNGIKSRGA